RSVVSSTAIRGEQTASTTAAVPDIRSSSGLCVASPEASKHPLAIHANPNPIPKILPNLVLIARPAPRPLDQLEHPSRGGAQRPFPQPDDAETANHPWSDDRPYGNSFSADAADRPGWNDRSAHAGAYEAHHRSKLRYRHDVVQREPLGRSSAVDDAPGDGFVRQRDQRLARQVGQSDPLLAAERMGERQSDVEGLAAERHLRNNVRQLIDVGDAEVGSAAA